MTRMTRLVLLVAAIGFAAVSSARAAYPEKPIKIVVGFPAGSTGDFIARALGSRLGESLGQAVVIDNRTGAGSSIAAEFVARSPGDGYTLLLSTTANVINQSVSSSLKFDFMRDLAPVMLIAENPVLLVSTTASAYSSVPALIAAAKAAPGKITFASSGNGTFTHLYGELFNQSAGIKLTHVPYRGSTQAITDVLSGQVDLAFTPATPVLGQVKGARLKALAVIGKKRMAALPDVPTFAEVKIPGFDLALWFGLHAPAGTPPAVIDKLSGQLARLLDSADLKALLAAQSIDVVADGPARFAEQIARENVQWARIVKTADIKEE